MLGKRIASQSEVIRAIVSGYSPCLWGRPHQQEEELAEAEAGEDRLEVVLVPA